MHQHRSFVFAILLILLRLVKCGISDNKVEDECTLSEKLKREIQSYAPFVEKIIKTATEGNFKGKTYSELSDFVDKFGARKTGSLNLENAIDYMMNLSRSNGLENVHGEEVVVPNWIRGDESARLIAPRRKNIAILGLGYSVGTPPEGILADVLVVKTFKELKDKASQAKGKIVVFNQDYITYGKSVQYRGYGAVEAAKVGAVASLIRSVTPFSLNTPHTGMQHYETNVTKIPTACIAVEDADLLNRLQERGENLKILLKMNAKNLPNEKSRNTVVEIQGKEHPEKVVIVSGHLDSWDVGQGAMDDGGGVFISWGALAVIKSLGLQPRRTIRAIFWTGEEFGLIGAQAYKATHDNESQNFNFIMESDIGTFTPLGIEYSAGKKGGCILQEVVKLLQPINATQAKNGGPGVGSDITIWTSEGFPGASLLNKNDRYFWYHHTEADTMDVENSDDLDKATAVWASVAYVLADLSVDFPRDLPAGKINPVIANVMGNVGDDDKSKNTTQLH